MQREDLHKLIKELRNPPVRLPLHQKALREHLVEAHAARVQDRRSLYERLAALRAQLAAAVAKKSVHLGAMLIAAIVLVGLVLLLPSNESPSGERILVKAPKVKSTTHEPAVSTAVCGRSIACPGVAADQDRGSSSPPAEGAAYRPSPAVLDSTTTSPVALRLPVDPAAPLNNIPATPVVAAEVAAIPVPVETPISISVHLDIGEILTGDKDKSKKEKANKEAKEDKEKKDKAERSTAGL